MEWQLRATFVGRAKRVNRQEFKERNTKFVWKNKNNRSYKVDLSRFEQRPISCKGEEKGFIWFFQGRKGKKKEKIENKNRKRPKKHYEFHRVLLTFYFVLSHCVYTQTFVSVPAAYDF